MITADQNGKLTHWYVDVGAMVEEGQVIADLEQEGILVTIHAPASGRLTEMMALPDDAVEAGKVIGWIDAITAAEETPQPLSALIDAPERKQKPVQKRKPRPARRLSPAVWVLIGLVVAMTAGALLVLLFVMPVGPAEIVVVTPPPPQLMPTPRFRINERVIYREVSSDIQWGTQGVIRDSGYDPASGTWYDVQFGNETRRVTEFQLEDVGVLAPTPTMQFNTFIGDGSQWLILKVPVADFPTGTQVMITSAMFNGVEWELGVVTENGVHLNVHESQLDLPLDALITPPATP